MLRYIHNIPVPLKKVIEINDIPIYSKETVRTIEVNKGADSIATVKTGGGINLKKINVFGG